MNLRDWVFRLLFSAVVLATATVWADGPDFRYRPQLAGRASLTEPGFVPSAIATVLQLLHLV